MPEPSAGVAAPAIVIIAAIAILIAKRKRTAEIDGLQPLEAAGLGERLDAGGRLKADHDKQTRDHETDEHLRMAP